MPASPPIRGVIIGELNARNGLSRSVRCRYTPLIRYTGMERFDSVKMKQIGLYSQINGNKSIQFRKEYVELAYAG